MSLSRSSLRPTSSIDPSPVSSIRTPSNEGGNVSQAWIDQVFNSQIAKKGGGVRRKVTSVDRFSSEDELKKAVRSRGFHMTLHGDQYIIYCERLEEVIQADCSIVSKPRKWFVRQTGKRAAIGSLDDIAHIVSCEAGTCVSLTGEC